MVSIDRTRGDPVAAAAESALAAPPAGDAAGGSWVTRVQRSRTRHAAITRNLYSFANYKSWADQVKGAWEQELPKRK
jgi:hypothetical protein